MNIQSSINSLLSTGAYLKKMGDVAKKESVNNINVQTPSQPTQPVQQPVEQKPIHQPPQPVNQKQKMNEALQRMANDGLLQVNQRDQFKKRIETLKGKRKPGQF